MIVEESPLFFVAALLGGGILFVFDDEDVY
jgi:hypothetical protein